MTLDRWLTIAGVFASAIISWLVSRYFYKRSDKRRTPTFVVNPTRKVLSAPGLVKLQGLAVLLRGHRIGERGVTEAEIYFWNSGTLPILRGDVLEPFSVTLPAAILQYDVLKSSRAAVSIEVIGDEAIRPETLVFQFAVLEPGDGATIRLVYDGPPDAKMEFKGSCLDAPKPTILPFSDLHFRSRTHRIFELFTPLLALPLMLILLACFAAAFVGIILLLKWAATKLGWWGWIAAHSNQLTGALLILFFGGMIAAAMWNQFKRVTAKNVPPDIKP